MLFIILLYTKGYVVLTRIGYCYYNGDGKQMANIGMYFEIATSLVASSYLS